MRPSRDVCAPGVCSLMDSPPISNIEACLTGWPLVCFGAAGLMKEAALVAAVASALVLAADAGAVVSAAAVAEGKIEAEANMAGVKLALAATWPGRVSCVLSKLESIAALEQTACAYISQHKKEWAYEKP
ncbi:hypothetical protein GGI03_005456 [Coemansia sp. RSA 2337]|nr:hypothetical protein GGI03_005456 [Coemansia sp. RSA 2337]